MHNSSRLGFSRRPITFLELWWDDSYSPGCLTRSLDLSALSLVSGLVVALCLNHLPSPVFSFLSCSSIPLHHIQQIEHSLSYIMALFITDKNVPRSYTWVWILRIVGIVLSLVALGLSASLASALNSISCVSSSKINFNVAVVRLQSCVYSDRYSTSF